MLKAIVVSVVSWMLSSLTRQPGAWPLHWVRYWQGPAAFAMQTDGEGAMPDIARAIEDRGRGTMLETIGFRAIEVSERHALCAISFAQILLSSPGSFWS